MKRPNEQIYQDNSLPIILHLSDQIGIYRGGFYNSIHVSLVMQMDISSFLQNISKPHQMSQLF